MAAANSLPPGSSGLSLLGETLAFASNPFAFVLPPEYKSGLVVAWSKAAP